MLRSLTLELGFDIIAESWGSAGLLDRRLYLPLGTMQSIPVLNTILYMNMSPFVLYSATVIAKSVYVLSLPLG